ncbi:chondroitin sulfate N-acetylgalactosaminyltransferase 2 isoform X1 [Periplaneta americana]|uniref:chondroitin sulfate N-acetylgalactosaminyltransferase 2 isoform X1 n=1 Tax=Periplaneta americana TaxID=6978 RepID=UPI0037E92B12
MLRVLGMRLLTRLLLLVCSLSLVSLLFLSRCGLNVETEVQLDPGTGASVGQSQPQLQQMSQQPQSQQSVNSYIQLLQQREEENRAEVERLTAEIRSLKLQLLQVAGNGIGPSVLGSQQLQDTPTLNFNLTSSSSSSMQGISGVGSGDCVSYIRRQLSLAEISRGLPLNNEYELIAFSHFTFSRVYPVDLGLGKRVVEKPIGFKRKDLLEALVKALESLNKNVTTPSPLTNNNHHNQNSKNSPNRYTLDDFLEGLYRSEPTTGTQYEMYFRTKNINTNNKSHMDQVPSVNGVTKVILMRPFAPLQTISTETLPVAKDKELIHIILPLSGRTATFQSFMDKFVKIALKNDRRVHLTVVYFGEEGLAEARGIMSRVLMTKNSGGNSNNLRLLALNETFSRGKGLRVGAERDWDQQGLSNSPLSSRHNGDVLLFMCDVDVVFSARFLDRCRWNTEPGRKVYYPVVFSLYNPHVVYTLQGKEVPPETDQLVISRDTGFWRDFGYGMTCQYRSDFLRVRGFDEEIVGWGGEDVMLYRKYVRSHVKVVRATDPGIFHIWHPKVCSGGPGGQKLSADQYRACIRSRALNEASHAQLGFLAFRDEIANQNNVNNNNNKGPGYPSAHKEET